MSDAPERIWAWNTANCDGDWTIAEGQGIPYVRADIHAALVAERDALREAHVENARILGLLENELQGRIEAGKLAAISKCADRARAAMKGQNNG